MAMYVLVEFDEDSQALNFLKKLKGKSSFRAKGLFKKPTKFCECELPISESQRSLEMGRGERYGWLMHRRCRRARRAPQSPRNLLESDRPSSDRDIFLHLPIAMTVHNVSQKSH